MSTYLQIKADIEKLELEKQELARKLEAARVAELEAECVDMKKRIIAFGIQPHMLFNDEELKPPKQRRSTAGKPYPIKFRHQGNEWTGTGAMPKWYVQAMKDGVKPEQMLVPGVKLGKLPKLNGASAG